MADCRLACEAERLPSCGACTGRKVSKVGGAYQRLGVIKATVMPPGPTIGDPRVTGVYKPFFYNDLRQIVRLV